MRTESELVKAGIAIRQPPEYQWLATEPKYDAHMHLSLEEPERVWTLQDFGYTEKEQNDANFPLAITAPFRVLSKAGVKALQDVVTQLRDFNRGSTRMAKFVRGGVYRSRFLRDLCNCPVLNQFLARLAGAPIVPHTMPLYQGHINLKPEEEGREVDKWHLDTVALDYVLLVTDPSQFTGGSFEYLPMRRELATEALRTGTWEDKVIRTSFPAAGYAVLQQGNMVVHRANTVESGDERTTLVNSFLPIAPGKHDVAKLTDCKPVDPPEVLYTEWARHKAFLSREKLAHLIETLPYSDDKEAICRALREAVRDVETAIMEITDPSEGRLVSLGNDALTDPRA